MHIVADENIPGLESLLPAGATLERVHGRGLKTSAIARADALLVRSVTQVNAALLADTPVQFVGSATSGFDHVDRNYLERAGVAFAFAPGANANAVVEYVLSAIAVVDDYLARLLDGGRVGIVGYGHIGHALARRLRLLGIACAVYDPWLPEEGRRDAASLDDVLRCDVVTCHAELTTREPYSSLHLFDADVLSALGSQQLLINASRGPVVDNKALLARCGAADAPTVVLDVWEGEPAIDAGLLEAVAIGTPHIAGYSIEGKLRGSAMLVEALGAWFGVECGQSRGAGDRVLSAPSGDLSAVISANYAIAQDDADLRTAMHQTDPAQAFDRLRREYSERRELLGAIVRVPSVTSEQRDLLAALGLSVELNP